MLWCFKWAFCVDLSHLSARTGYAFWIILVAYFQHKGFICFSLCWLQLYLTTGCLKGCEQWQEKWKRRKKVPEEVRQERHRGGSRWKERHKPKVEGGRNGAAAVDLGYVLTIGWAPLYFVCFCSIFTMQSESGNWWMAPYVGWITFNSDHSAWLGQVVQRDGDVIWPIWK